MRVAIDARKLRDGGIGTYTRALIAELSATQAELKLTALLAPEDVGSVAWPGPVRELAVSARKYGLAEHWRVPAAVRAAGAELLHVPHYTLPLLWRGPAVVTIHDLIHLRFPQFFPLFSAQYARAVAGAAARAARVVCADSECTRRDVIELLGADPARVRVVPLGVSDVFSPAGAAECEAFRAARGLPEGYVLYVGARKGHKNLALLLRAWATLPAAARPPLVLSGERWAAGEPLAREARALGVESSVRFSGATHGDAELRLLYAAAALYVHPALYEGFGLPPLEAMACGTPVLASDAGSLLEVVGDAADVLPPREPEAWGARVQALLGDADQRAALVARGRERAARFRWATTARLTFAAYEDALRG